MPESLRTFVGIKIAATPALRRVIAELEAMGKSLKPARPESLHVTLKFLGDTDANRVADVSRALTEAAAEKTAFDAELLGLGVFPHARRPSVVWTGIRHAETLVDIAVDLEDRLERLGWPREQRAFQPHLTLARVRSKPPPRLAELLAEHETTPFGVARVASVILFQSELGPQGSRYTPLATAALSEQ